MRSEARNAINKRFLKAYRILYLNEKVRMKKDFFQKSGDQPQNLSTIERGDLSCTIENIYNLSTNFGVSLNCFFWERAIFIPTIKYRLSSRFTLANYPFRVK